MNIRPPELFFYAMNIISHIRQKAAFLSSIVLAAVLTGCSNSFIYDYEGDCEPNYRVRFRYDYNLKYADAFASEVDHVTLSVVDADGKIVYTHRESGDALKADGYEVVLDDKVKPGKYRLHAWCGSGAEPGNGSFAVHEADVLTDLRCTLLPDPATRADIAGAEGTHLNRRLDNLYHGLTGSLDFVDDEGTHTFEVPLMKNTNSIKVVLQHLSSTPLNAADFDFVITSANARMDHDNSIIAADPVKYHAWSVRPGSATINPGDPNTGGDYTAAVAEFTIGRLMADEDVRLEVFRKSDGEKVFSVNIVDMALLVKSANLASMPAQEFLDRQDDYNFIFFLDQGLRWTQVQINILSWTLVQYNTEI